MTSKTIRLEFGKITKADLPRLTEVMKRAFDDDAQKHLGQESGGPPGYDDGEFFRTWLFPYEESVGYKILFRKSIIGGIIVWIMPDDHNILGTIFVDPDSQDMGVGQESWRFIEASYPETKSWRLGTPEWATKNHHFYVKCGFGKVVEDPLIAAKEGMTIYRKEIEAD